MQKHNLDSERSTESEAFEAVLPRNVFSSEGQRKRMPIANTADAAAGSSEDILMANTDFSFSQDTHKPR